MVHSLNPLDYPPRFQFGNGESFALERTACTDTAVRMIINYWKEKDVSLYAIRKASGVPIDGVHGLTMQGALNALDAFGVTWYKTRLNVSATDILQAAYKGPVLAGVGYRAYPGKKGGPCSQNNTAVAGGKTDCQFKDAHAILVLGNIAVKNSKGKVAYYDAITRDPDHHVQGGPDHDRIHGAQLTAAIKALVMETAWAQTFMLYPTKKKTL